MISHSISLRELSNLSGTNYISGKTVQQSRNAGTESGIASIGKHLVRLLEFGKLGRPFILTIGSCTMYLTVVECEARQIQPTRSEFQPRCGFLVVYKKPMLQTSGMYVVYLRCFT